MNNINKTAELIAQKDTILTRSRLAKPKKWADRFNQLCDLVDEMSYRYKRGERADVRLLEKAQKKVDHVASVIPRHWWGFRTPEQIRIAKAQETLRSLSTMNLPEPRCSLPERSLFIPRLNTPTRLLTFLLASGIGSSLERPKTDSLKQSFVQMGNELAKTMPLLDRCPPQDSSWAAAAPMCFSVESLENSLKTSMDAARAEFPPIADVGIGNKHLNLLKMHQLVQRLNIQGLNIPMPHGISTQEIAKFLHDVAPEVFIHWEALKNASSLEDPIVKGHLQAIDEAIQKAFLREDAFDRLNPDRAFREWLRERQKRGDSLMVRSTGAEDSKSLANAGGNVSKAYVAPKPKAVCEAIGDVIRSYFAPPSLLNRLNAGFNPFKEALSLGVTAQELIGETSSKIPTSFVAFTNEPLYIGDEKFRAMRISATYGHGESVVSNNGVATDTFLILRSEAQPDQIYILKNLRDKPTRLAPIREQSGMVLRKVANPKELQGKASLDEEQLKDLYRYAVLIESYYDGEPTDIEGVVRGDEIHFVQARPVNRKPLLPTFLKGREGIAAKERAKVLVTGTASVVTIEKREEILVVPTLEEAQKLYNKDIHKLIVVEQDEPENSHPVVNFSSLGVPCLCAKSIEEISNRIDGDHPIAVCMQTGTLNLWDRKIAKLEDQIVEGFATHPAKIGSSLSAPRLSLSTEGPSLFSEEFFERIRSGDLKALEELERHPEFIKLKDLPLDQLPMIQQRVEVLRELGQKISKAIEEMRAVLKCSPNDRMKRLLYAKNLEVLLKKGDPASLSSYGLEDVGTIVDEIEKLKTYQQELGKPSKCIGLLLEGNVNSHLYPHWKQFLLEAEERISEAEVAQLGKLVGALKASGALPFWLTFFKSENTLDSLGPQDWALLEKALELQQSIRHLRSEIERFADPKSLPEAMEEIRNLKGMTPEEIQQASPIVRSIIYGLMHERIDLMDTAAKTLKASPRISNKAKLFKELLTPYFAMMREMAEEIVPPDAIPTHDDWPINDYLSRMRYLFETVLSENTPNALMPSRDFSVSAAMLGSGADFERHKPETLEDMLTLIHQNSLVCLDALNQRLISPEQIEKSLLPEPVKKILAQVEQENWGRTVQRVGMEIEGRKITFKYNVPLRNHSGHIEFEYNTETQKITMKGQLLGEARERWGETALWIEDLEEFDETFTPTRPRTQNEQELTFYWDVDLESINKALRDYAEMANYSLGERVGEFYNHFERFKDKPQIIDKLAKRKCALTTAGSLNFCERYIDRGENLQITIDGISKAAQANAQFKDPMLHIRVMRLFNKLVDKGHGIKEAIQAAEAGAQIEEPMLYMEVIDLFKKLVDKGIGINQAIKTVQAWVQRVSRNLYFGSEGHKATLDFFIELIMKGHGIKEAIETAQANAQHENSEIRVRMLLLFRVLIARGDGIKEAIETAQANAQHVDANVREQALTLLGELVDKGHGIDEAIKAAQANAQHVDANVREQALSFLYKLVDKGHGLEEAIQIAQSYLQHNDTTVCWDGIKLFEKLIDKEHGIKEAIQTAQANAQYEDRHIRFFGIELFTALSYRGHGIEEGIIASRVIAQHEDPVTRYHGLLHFLRLVENGHGIKEAKEAAQANINHPERPVSDLARQILNAIERGDS